MTRLLALNLWLAAVAHSAPRDLATFAFQDQNGRSFKLEEMRGRYTLVSFVFTACPMPRMCPLTLDIAQRTLTAWQALPGYTRWLKPLHYLAVSIDPERDTPAVLKTWTQRYGLSALPFTFATGRPAEITEFAARFNVVAFPSGGTITHNVRTILLDPKLEIIAEFRDNESSLGVELTPEAVFSEMGPRWGRIIFGLGAALVLVTLAIGTWRSANARRVEKRP